MLLFHNCPNRSLRCKTFETGLLLMLFACSALAQMGSNAVTTGDGDFCVSFEYKQIAEMVLQKMKRGIEPCDDFYQFACGNFMDTTLIPARFNYVDSYTEAKGLYKKQIIKILEEKRPETEPKHFRLPNILFKACMDKKFIGNLSAHPIREVTESLGGWPVLVGHSWNTDNSWTWANFAKAFRRIGFSTDYIMTFSVDEDIGNKTRHIIYLDQPSLPFASSYYETSMELYYSYMIDLATQFGAKELTATKDLQAVIEFEKDLASICTESRNLQPPYLRSIKELQQSYPYVQWLDLINALLPEGLEVNENEMIQLYAPDFFNRLGLLLARTKKRVIANYMMWKFYYDMAPFISDRFRVAHHKFEASLKIAPFRRSRLDHCVKIVVDSLPISVGSLYSRIYVEERSKTTLVEIFKNIQNAFNQTLDESEWLDKKTRKEAKRKLYSIKAMIGFPDELLDNNRLENYYRKLEIDPNKFFQSYLKIRAFNLDQRFGLLRLLPSETEWLENVEPAKATISTCLPSLNTINIPAGLFQGQFYGIQRPNYMNYAVIGSTIGHEIVHGFCGRGCWYDADCKRSSWWQPISKRRFFKKVKCFVEQYNNFTDKQTGKQVDGFRTKSENIADNGGTKLSYLAYRQWMAEHGEEPRLPGLNYTSRQMFWISFAQKWCGKFTLNSAERIIANDSHAPHEFRVLGTLRNMKDFARDFNCPKNSPMNPAQKCALW